MSKSKRRKLLTELKDLEKLKKLYRKHVDAKITAIKKCDERIVVINLMLAKI